MSTWKRNIVANALGNASGVVFPLIFTPIYVRLLGIESYALVAFFASLMAMTYLLNTTFGATMTRELAQARFSKHGPDESRDLARTLEYFYAFASVLLAGICIYAAQWIATRWLNVEALPLPLVRTSVAMMGISVALQAPMTIYAGGLYGLERQTLLNAFMIALGAVRGLGAVAALLFVAPTTIVFFGWQIVFGILQLSCFAWLFWRCIHSGTRPARFSIPAFRRVGRFTSGMAATGFVTFFLSQISSILLSKLLPLPELGLYQIANQVNSGARILGAPIQSAILPRLSFHSAANDGVSFERIYHEACQLMAVLVLPASSIIVFFSWGLINVWIGNARIAGQVAPIATVLVIGSVLNNLLRVPYVVTLARGRSSYGFYQNLFAAIGFVPLLLFLIRTHGMLGAAYAWLILNVGYIALSVPILLHRMLPGHYVRWILEDVLVPLFASIALAFGLRMMISDRLPLLEFLAALFVWWLVSVVLCAATMRHTRQMLFRFGVQMMMRVYRA